MNSAELANIKLGDEVAIDPNHPSFLFRFGQVVKVTATQIHVSSNSSDIVPELRKFYKGTGREIGGLRYNTTPPRLFDAKRARNIMAMRDARIGIERKIRNIKLELVGLANGPWTSNTAAWIKQLADEIAVHVQERDA